MIKLKLKNMKGSFFCLLFVLVSITAKTQCEDVAIQVSSSDETFVQLYHAGFFNLPSGFDNICDWEVTDFSGSIIHEATTSGVWADQSFTSFSHSVPITDSMKVTLIISNETSGLTCEMNDTLFWKLTEILPGTFIGDWEVLSSNPGEDISFSLNLLEATNLNCFGDNNGFISVETAGGDAPFTFTINDGPVTSSSEFSNLSAGEYIIEASDSGGKTASLTVELTQPDELVVEILKTDLSCFESNDGEILAMASGGTSINGYAHFIDGAGPFSSGTFTDLPEGIYEITVEDDNACLVNEMVEIVQPDEIAIANIDLNHLTCFNETNGSINFDVSGGSGSYTYTYSEQQSTTTLPITNLSAGVYSITVTDQDSCNATFDVELTSPDTLTLDVIEIVNNDCNEENNGSITLSGSGGSPNYQYTIENEPNSTGQFENLASGDYIASLEDENGCIVEMPFVIGLDVDLQVDYDITNASCFGSSTGVVSIQIEGGNQGYTFFLNEEMMPSSEFTDLAAGSYNIAVEGANGCQFLDTVTISQPEAIALIDLEITSPICIGDSDGQIQFTIEGGSPEYQTIIGNDTLSSTDGAVILDGLEAGDLILLISDAMGCTLSDTVIIESMSSLSLESIVGLDVNCATGESGSITINASSDDENITFFVDSLTNSTGSFNGLNIGSYTAGVMDSNGCLLEEEVSIDTNGQINASIEAVQDITCFGMMDGSISVSVDGGNTGYTFQLDSMENEDGIFTELSPGSYSILISDAQNCATEIDFSIEDVEPLELELIDFTNDDGSGNGSFTVEASGGTEPYEYSIDDGVTYQSEPTFSDLENEMYTVLIQDTNGCMDSLFVLLTSIEEQELTATVNIYPSPVQLGEILNISSDFTIESISVVDMQGRVLMQKMYKRKYIQLNTDSFAEGIYILGIKTNQGEVWKKVVLVE